MKKLSKDELLGLLKEWTHRRKWIEEWDKDDEQAHKQIVALIKKPEVTDEWIEEKARELWLLGTRGLDDNILKDFIRSLVEEITGARI